MFPSVVSFGGFANTSCDKQSRMGGGVRRFNTKPSVIISVYLPLPLLILSRLSRNYGKVQESVGLTTGKNFERLVVVFFLSFFSPLSRMTSLPSEDSYDLAHFPVQRFLCGVGSQMRRVSWLAS